MKTIRSLFGDLKKLVYFTVLSVVLLGILLAVFLPRYNDLKGMPEIVWCELNLRSYGLYSMALGQKKRYEMDIIARNIRFISETKYIGHVTDEKKEYRGIALFDINTGEIEPVLESRRLDEELKRKAGGGGEDSGFYVSGDMTRIYFQSYYGPICCYHMDADRIDVIVESEGSSFFVTEDESYLYYLDDDYHLIRLNLETDEYELIIDRTSWFAVSSDGRFIAHMLTGGPLKLYDAETDETVVVRNNFSHKTKLLFSGNGEYLLFTDYDSYPLLHGYDYTNLYVYNVKKKSAHRVYRTKHGTDILGITWKE